MEKLLIQYLKNYYSQDDNFNIWKYDIHDSICVVHFYVNGDKWEQEVKEINIWDMLIFVNEKI